MFITKHDPRRTHPRERRSWADFIFGRTGSTTAIASRPDPPARIQKYGERTECQSLAGTPALLTYNHPHMKIGVIVFPGSNRDHDAWYTLTANLGVQAEYVWHDVASLAGYDALILPGGFSYGDYLRCGA